MAREGKQIVVDAFGGEFGKDYGRWFDEQLAKFATNEDPEAEDLTGSLLRWQRADGYAYYVVTKHRPLTLSHLHIGDAWTIEPALIRGLRADDVRDQLERARGWSRANRREQAIRRVERAGVKTDRETISRFVESVSAETILKSTLAEIREVAAAF